ncbi:MAG: dihydrofolate reductase [Prosthecobacter sp.]|uniref:dihydrofolate reductase n=1 Tax=Prosthecobacter sp. TaxID=1965333 RepID=UPI0039000656
MPRLIAIVAMSSNRVIGRAGTLPWHFPEDLKFFKRTTLGHPILMGRATFDSIGRPLPGRQNIVLSTTMSVREGVTVIRSAAELPQVCGDAETVFVIGGARVFAELLPQCDGLYLTWIAEPYEGDVLLPPFENLFQLKEIIGQSEGLEFRYYAKIESVG